MFAVIYLAKIKPGLEDEYQRVWRQIVKHFVTQCGALGSCLHRTEDGSWLAYSRWPDKATRDAVFIEQTSPLLTPEIKQALEQMKNCIIEQAPEICLEVVNDFLINKLI